LTPKSGTDSVAFVFDHPDTPLSAYRASNDILVPDLGDLLACEVFVRRNTVA
jgi:hypothetical protein